MRNSRSGVVSQETVKRTDRHPTSIAAFAVENSTMRIEPLGDQIVIKRLEAEEITVGGIVLPDSAQQKPQQGRVLSVGDGRLLPNGSRTDPQVSEGDRVMFASYAGNEVIVDNEMLLIMSEEHIFAILD
jgi:chaperonin GroES